jgi:hypothetical protein
MTRPAQSPRQGTKQHFGANISERVIQFGVGEARRPD